MVILKELEDGETPSPSEQELNASEGGQRSSTNDTDQKELDDGETPSPSEQELNASEGGQRSSTNDTDKKELDDGETPSPSEQELNSNDRGEQSSTNNADDVPEQLNLFERLPDDIVIDVLCELSSAAKCPSDFISVRFTCRSLYTLSRSPIVLVKMSPETFGRAKNWSEFAMAFLRDCVDAGNIEACYTSGVIAFYCFENRRVGEYYIHLAVEQSHVGAMYSLAVIRLNGSGPSESEKSRRVGVMYCSRAAHFGHINATREFGHCLIKGYGVSQDIPSGQAVLNLANTRELSIPLSSNHQGGNRGSIGVLNDTGRKLFSNYRHPVDQFLIDWFGMQELGQGLRLCSNMECGRPETRLLKFRQCGNCHEAIYCSYVCQMCDWKLRHRADCLQLNEVEVMPELEAAGAMPELEAADEMPEEAPDAA
ncbi:hypothetical protein GIB67_009348 [Kingdonia uniflora]|uniref:MYND-type domain-containing protein n=1 Tax=Kingdonia uniflora TaxID=39325 RepID=A0A7J7N2P4_9MAGN|nr:hypothetical protein GIB67_009348 [Kingdonia uniflora]